jgi:protein-L-isoaspartate(D-aspartate) O-methyltransferase|tara:strand:+ start:6684 stop:7331 length:648 start_codon:yes stop_codon:yes gene_type:complete
MIKVSGDMKRMVNTIQMHDNSIDEKVLDAIKRVPRHKFVDVNPYEDTPVLIGHGQTISQPFIVAYMTHKLDIEPSHKVLEIGTGSGYQAAVLSELAKDVYSVERIDKLLQRTKKLFEKIGYENIKLKVGDGYKGWDENAPYDRIIVTASAKRVPKRLLEQLNVGGKLIIPIQNLKGIANSAFRVDENLILVIKEKDRIIHEKLLGVMFVPLVEGL